MDSLLKQFLIKQANTTVPMPAFQGHLLPAGVNPADTGAWGSALARDLQEVGHLQPNSPEYLRIMQERGYDPEYMQGLTSMGQRAMALAQNPNAVRGFAAGNYDPYTSQMGQGIDPVQAVGGWWNAGKAVAPSLLTGAAIGSTQLNRNLFGTNAAGQWNPLGLRDAWNAGTGAFQAGVQAPATQLPQNVMRGLDRNSPFVRAFLANVATTHMGNKIDDWTSGRGSFGRQLRGMGHFLLGAGSKLPGYEYIANKAIDWLHPEVGAMFGKKSASIRPTPYSHYRVIRTKCGSEILTPWNRL